MANKSRLIRAALLGALTFTSYASMSAENKSGSLPEYVEPSSVSSSSGSAGNEFVEAIHRVQGVFRGRALGVVPGPDTVAGTGRLVSGKLILPGASDHSDSLPWYKDNSAQ